MAHRGIAGHAFGQDRLGQDFLLFCKELFYSAMLVSQVDLQVQDPLTMTDEPEMSRFDDAGVDGADPDFMQCFSLDGIKGIIVHHTGLIGPVERITDGLQPGMTLEFNAELLMDLPLKDVELEMSDRDGVK